MDKSAIQEITSLALASNDLLNDHNAVVIPAGYALTSLEHLQDAPRFFDAKFSTPVLSEFTAYVNEHAIEDTHVFINPEKMSASSIIDIGAHETPQWGKHRAELKLIKTPGYAGLVELTDRALSQQQFIDFAEDWQDNISFYFGDTSFAGAVPFTKVINILRKLKVNTNQSAEQSVGNFNANRSALESIEITAGTKELPAGFVFKAIPYEGFKEVAFTCQLRAINQEKNVQLKYRIGQLALINEQIANQIREKLTDGLQSTDGAIHIFIGDLRYQ